VSLDLFKEILNTLRTILTINIAVILTITASLIKMYYQNNIDFLFYFGIFLDIVIFIIIILIIKSIMINIKKIKEL
jgi:hypothetical protein